MSRREELIQITEQYYDSKNADEFYHTVWGGEDIHIGIYEDENTPILKASKRTVKKMATMAEPITPGTEIIDIGAGYGGAARYLAQNYDCQISCLNLSKVENKRNQEKNKVQGLDHLIEVVTGNFEEMPFKEEKFDVLWSEDAILHSDNKKKVFEEAYRIAKKGATFIFTDPMQSDDCPEGVLQPILERIHLKQLGSVKMYRELADTVGFSVAEIIEMPEQLVYHYSAVLSKLEKEENQLLKIGCEQTYIENMKKGLRHWIEGGKKGYLNWGILKFVK